VTTVIVQPCGGGVTKDHPSAMPLAAESTAKSELNSMLRPLLWPLGALGKAGSRGAVQMLLPSLSSTTESELLLIALGSTTLAREPLVKQTAP
jgi:hypothetical protein